MKKQLIAVLILFASCSKQNVTNSALNGTIWKYKDFETSYIVLFDTANQLRNTNQADRTLNNDYWQQMKDKVSFKFNDYSEYKGILQDSVIVGEGKNKIMEWDFEMIRVKD